MSPWPQPTKDGAMCSICLYWFHIDLLATDPEDNRKTDTCVACWHWEQEEMRKRNA